MKTITIKLVLSGRELSNGEYRVYLRIIKDRKKKDISIGLKAQKNNFINESFTKQHPNCKIENELLLKLKGRAYTIIRELQLKQNDFTFEEFEDK